MRLLVIFIIASALCFPQTPFINKNSTCAYDRVYFYEQYSAIASGRVFDFAIETGSNNKTIEIQCANVTATVKYNMHLYENVKYTNYISELTAYNFDCQLVTNVITRVFMIQTNVTTDTYITNIGTYLISKYATETNGRPFLPDFGHIYLKSNTAYLFRISSTAAGALNRALPTILIYEK